MKKKLLISLILISLLIVTSISLSIAYSVRETEKGALQPEPEKGIIKYSNPRYKNDTMIDWESKR